MIDIKISLRNSVRHCLLTKIASKEPLASCCLAGQGYHTRSRLGASLDTSFRSEGKCSPESRTATWPAWTQPAWGREECRSTIAAIARRLWHRTVQSRTSSTTWYAFSPTKQGAKHGAGREWRYARLSLVSLAEVHNMSGEYAH